MTGGTGGGNGFGQGDLHGCVRIRVTFQAIHQSEMGCSLVTTAARRDNIFVTGRMADMTVQATEFVAVGLAFSLEDRDDCRVTFHTIVKGERLYGWCFVAWFGDGFTDCVARETEEYKYGYGQSQIFGCKYQLSYYCYEDVMLRRWGCHHALLRED